MNRYGNKAWAYDRHNNSAKARRFQRWRTLKELEIKEEKLKADRAFRHSRRRHWINLYKQKVGCQQCGFKGHPVQFDFDHIDPNTKLFNISSSLARSIKTLMSEIRKCRLVCANCHRLHTHT